MSFGPSTSEFTLKLDNGPIRNETLPMNRGSDHNLYSRFNHILNT